MAARKEVHMIAFCSCTARRSGRQERGPWWQSPPLCWAPAAATQMPASLRQALGKGGQEQLGSCAWRGLCSGCSSGVECRGRKSRGRGWLAAWRCQLERPSSPCPALPFGRHQSVKPAPFPWLPGWLQQVVSLAAGARHSCAVNAAGQCLAWGWAEHGEFAPCCRLQWVAACCRAAG